MVGARQVSITVTYSGPLPRPEMLRSCNEVVPGVAERILAMAERQSAHRRQIESVVIAANVSTEKRARSPEFFYCHKKTSTLRPSPLTYMSLSAIVLSVSSCEPLRPSRSIALLAGSTFRTARSERR